MDDFVGCVHQTVKNTGESSCGPGISGKEGDT